jgi:fatty acid desaturase
MMRTAWASPDSGFSRAQVQHELLSNVRWHDLLAVSPLRAGWELALSLPWLVLSCSAAAMQLWPIALAASFFFFLTGLRQVHGAFHHSTGLPRWINEALLLTMSVLMLGSMHAVKFNHLRHHRLYPSPEDEEGQCARMRAWQVVLLGPRFPMRLICSAWRLGQPSVRRWMVVELIANALAVALVLFAVQPAWLVYHLTAMVIAQSLTGFFAVWTVHHDSETASTRARTIRGRLKARMTYNMFFHVEHHLFPAVPTCRLAALATRLDVAAPDLARLKVL